jgi:hypothetical protein
MSLWSGAKPAGLCLALAALGGCGSAPLPSPGALGGNPSATERCVETMRVALDGGRFDVAGQNTQDESITTSIVTIDATRGDVAPSPAQARDISGQCRFDHGVLVDFHWTKSPLG